MNFFVDGLSFKVQTENKIKNQSLVKHLDGEICEYLLEIEFDGEMSPLPYVLSWEEPQIDIIGFWSSKAGMNHNITPDWWMRREESRTASGMPLIALYSKQNINRELIALSDASTPTTLMAGVVEENGKINYRVELFSKICPKMTRYSIILRIDRRKIPVYRAIMDTKTWWGGEAYVPDAATLPMYSCWYSLHQNTLSSEIIEQCKMAKALGMETVIVDDGWQTRDNSRGYAFCGDWEICEQKIPDMKALVDEIHALGMKFLVWFSVPFVGFESKNYKRFEGKYLYRKDRMNASVLDIRFKEVRDFLCETYEKYVSEYGWDGLKLDFIDSFEQTEESSVDYESMDTVSVEEALDRLLCEVTARLRAINPEILIEFRQSYVGPVVARYGNMFRVTDCPNDAILNRVHSLYLRMTSGKTAVHSDMLMWNENDTNESVMYQLLAIMFCVPQISVRLEKITDDQRALLKNYLSFWRAHRQTLLDGGLTLSGMDANYTVARSENDAECISVLYQSVPLALASKTEYVFNSTGDDFVYVESESERMYEVYDFFGNKISSAKIAPGVTKISVKNCWSLLFLLKKEK